MGPIQYGTKRHPCRRSDTILLWRHVNPLTNTSITSGAKEASARTYSTGAIELSIGVTAKSRNTPLNSLANWKHAGSAKGIAF